MEFSKEKIFFKTKTIAIEFSLAIFFLCLFSCDEQINTKKIANDKQEKIPSQVVYNMDFIQHDSGRINLMLHAPLVEKYEEIDTPYTETTKGIYVEFFDKKKKNPGKMWADYAKTIEKKDLFFAKGHVKVIDPEGKTFLMNSIHWNKKEKTVTTKDTVHITDPDGNSYVGKGLHAKDDFSEYRFGDSKGLFNEKKSETPTNKQARMQSTPSQKAE